MGLVPFEWALQKVLGPTLDEIGEDFRRVYVTGRERLVDAARRKIDDIEDGKVANRRVAMDVLANGSIASGDEVCAEYFGGLLAASRTKDGKDDSLMPLVDSVKALSSEQLRIHYYLYRALDKALRAYTPRPNTRAQPNTIYIFYVGAPDSTPGCKGDLAALRQRDLVGSATTGIPLVRAKADGREWVVPYVAAEVTDFGKMLYAAAYNNLMWWQALGTLRTEHHEDFPGVPIPPGYGLDLTSLLECVHKDDAWELVRPNW